MSDPSGSLADMNLPLLGGADVEEPIPAAVEACRVTYSVRSGSKKEPFRTILSDVSCSFPPGKMSAVMGASGCGKTSLLGLVRGLSSPGSVLRGEVSCNGYRVDPELMRRVTRVVPQHDVFLSALTPREMLSFAAELRLPRKFSAHDRRQRVEALLASLRLEPCASTRIGDEALGLPGISGGERKRLSVGLAVTGGLPQLLLCDEPTSGLDSSAASTMTNILKGIANRGVTVICAIHQPSYDMYKEFEHLLLLENGRVIYSGAVGHGSSVEAYFGNHGCPTPENTNPAHHYVTETQANGALWACRWKEQLEKEPAGKFGQAKTWNKSRKTSSTLSMWEQTLILTRRTLLENFKNKNKFIKGIMSRLPPSIMIGLIFLKIAEVPSQESIFPVKGVMFVASQNPLIETFYAGATTVQQTRVLLKREYYDGMYQVMPYYLSYYFGFLAMQLPWVCVWVLPMYLLVGFPLDFVHVATFTLASFLVILMACAAGSAVGALTRNAEGNRAVLMPLLIPMVLLSGYVIPFAQIPFFCRFIYYASPVQWAMSLLEMNHYQGLDFVDCDSAIPIENRHCYATGEELLQDKANPLALLIGTRGVILIHLCFIGFFMLLNMRTIRCFVLDGRL